MRRSIIIGGTKGLGKALADESAARGMDRTIVTGSSILEPEPDDLDQSLIESHLNLTDIGAFPCFYHLVGEQETPFLEEHWHNYLFWNAGIFLRGPFRDASLDEIKAMVQVHLFGPLMLLVDLTRMLTREKGNQCPPSSSLHLVTIASTSSYRVREQETIYCALKAAKAHLTRNLARELAECDGCRTTLVNPGGMATPNFWQESGQDMAGYMQPEAVAKIIWDEVLGQTDPYKEISLLRDPKGNPQLIRGPQTPEDPFTTVAHELVGFKPCTFGDGGFNYQDGADRAICSCGWKSAPVQRDKTALVALWKAHRDTASNT